MNKFYCPWCDIKFGSTDKDKLAKCPICRRARDDNLNQISPEKFQCVICGCSFSNSSKGIPICPNACKSGGKNENE
ncbi:MAG: hypothetical protein U9P63_01705 [Patescibacteria group bacterium]|nr:hypothetical protein [Patescibacteria group bacterium]